MDLVRTSPLAWVVSPGAAPLPLRPKLDAARRIVRLDGHFVRHNALLEELRTNPQALILFMGPQGYISPSWFADHTQAPTWCYASVQFVAELELFDDPARIEASLRDLINGVEARLPNRWTLERTGELYHRLARGVVAFKAEVREVRAAFKLGQKEREDVLQDILVALPDDGDHAIGGWIARMNADRLGAPR